MEAAPSGFLFLRASSLNPRRRWYQMQESSKLKGSTRPGLQPLKQMPVSKQKEFHTQDSCQRTVGSAVALTQELCPMHVEHSPWMSLVGKERQDG